MKAVDRAEEVQRIGLMVVRGERPWQDIALLGVQIRGKGRTMTSRVPADVEINASLVDLATGMLSYLNAPDELQYWSFVVLRIIDIESVSTQWTANPELFLDSLWDGIEQAAVSDEVVSAARQVVTVH